MPSILQLAQEMRSACQRQQQSLISVRKLAFNLSVSWMMINLKFQKLKFQMKKRGGPLACRLHIYAYKAPH